MIQKTKVRATRTPINTGGEFMWSGRCSNSYSTSDTRHVTFKRIISTLINYCDKRKSQEQLK